MPKPNGINIQLTPSQFDYLYEVIMMAYELDVPDQKDGTCKPMIIWLTTLPTELQHISQTM